MHEILDEQHSTLDLSSVEFRGTLAQKKRQLDQSTGWLKRCRFFIFTMAAVIFYPFFILYFLHGYFSSSLLAERIVFGAILVLAGLFFYKFRLQALLISLIPLGTIIATYLFTSPELFLNRLGFNFAIFGLLLFGIFHHFREKRLRDELLKEIKNGNPDAVI